MLGGPTFVTVANEWFSAKKLDNSNIIEIKVNINRATSYEVKRFKMHIDSLLNADYRNYILNLSECGLIDSIFLGTIITFYKKIKALNGNLKLVVDPNNTPVSISKTSLGEIFDIYTQIEAAIYSFNLTN